MVLSGLRDHLMAPEAYTMFRDRFRQHLGDSQGASQDALLLHDARVRKFQTSHRNLLRAFETGDDVSVLLPRLNAVDADLKKMKEKRDENVSPKIELPDDLPELYREMVTGLAASLSEESVVGRLADELHELIDRIDVDWDEEAKAHRLTIVGNLLEMLRKWAPKEPDAVRCSAI